MSPVLVLVDELHVGGSDGGTRECLCVCTARKRRRGNKSATVMTASCAQRSYTPTKKKLNSLKLGVASIIASVISKHPLLSA